MRGQARQNKRTVAARGLWQEAGTCQMAAEWWRIVRCNPQMAPEGWILVKFNSQTAAEEWRFTEFHLQNGCRGVNIRQNQFRNSCRGVNICKRRLHFSHEDLNMTSFFCDSVEPSFHLVRFLQCSQQLRGAADRQTTDNNNNTELKAFGLSQASPYETHNWVP